MKLLKHTEKTATVLLRLHDLLKISAALGISVADLERFDGGDPSDRKTAAYRKQSKAYKEDLGVMLQVDDIIWKMRNE